MIEPSEFTLAVLNQKSIPDEILKFAFKFFDSNDNGKIELAEVENKNCKRRIIVLEATRR